MDLNKFVLLFLLFILCLTFSGVVAAERVGAADYGYVDKEIYGNPHSNVTVIVVTGMHPLERETHEAMVAKLKSIPQDSSKCYVNYDIHVTKNQDDYNKGRMNGQLLAQKFIVPDVDQYHPILALDIHENRGKDSGYKYNRFLYLISPTTEATYYYASHIIEEMPFLVDYTPPNPTSTSYMTIPLANKGIPTIIYENYKYDKQKKKNTHMNTLINTIDTIDPMVDDTDVDVDPALSNSQYKAMWDKINKFKAQKGRLPNYVIVSDMHVGVDKITKDQYLDMQKRWEAYKNERNGQEPTQITINP